MIENQQESAVSEVVNNTLITHHTSNWDTRHRLDSVTSDIPRNQQVNTTEDVDTNGGWLVVHTTKTWDIISDSVTVDAQVQEKFNALQKAQAEYDAVNTVKAQIASADVQINAQVK